MPWVISDEEMKSLGEIFTALGYWESLEWMRKYPIKVEPIDAETLLTDEENHETVWRRAGETA